jgi:broad specificity phosphatase PhoE
VAVSILLVRHARAGRRDRWHGDDTLRPLSKKGRLQAQALPDLLASWTTGHPLRLVSSPWVRCIQTLEPLAASVGVTVTEDEILGEGMGPKAVEALSGWQGSRTTVLCTHGDVIEAILSAVANSGVDIGRRAQTAKGSAWVFDGSRKSITAATYLPPPS